MRCVRYLRFGGPEVLDLATIPEPKPQKSKLLVRVRAVSLNPLDWKIRRGDLRLMSGSSFPKVPCLDFCGVVEHADETTPGFRKGDEVYGALGSMKEGYLADLISVSASVVAKKPASISANESAAAAVVGLAAIAAIDAARVERGSRVLVNGCTGGVGLCVMQLAKSRGAHVTGVCGNDGMATAREYGADAVVDYRAGNAGELAPFSAVIELSARLSFEDARPLLSGSGIFVDCEPGAMKLARAFVLNPLRAQKHAFIMTKGSAAGLTALADQIDAGTLRCPPVKVFPMAQVREAFAFAERGSVLGKAVIRVDDEHE